MCIGTAFITSPTPQQLLQQQQQLTTAAASTRTRHDHFL